jgi:precorrin-6B methylase 1
LQNEHYITLDGDEEAPKDILYLIENNKKRILTTINNLAYDDEFLKI